MVASAVFITDHKGKALIHRNYRGTIPLSITTEFQRILVENEESELKPVLVDKEITYVFVKHNDLFLLSVTKTNSNVMLMLNFLYQIVSVFEDYFGGLEQESIRDNFVLIYELLDEMCDFGYPQFTDAKMLKDIICIKETNKLDITDLKQAQQVSSRFTGSVPWRGEGIKHKKNEVFLDVVEKLNLLVSNNGTVLHSEILGALKMKSYLSGFPELKLGLNDKIMMERRRRRRRRNTKMVEMDDIRFHQCVRLARFESDRTISFIPPDGEFELMSYRLDTQVRPLIWIECHKDIKSHSRIEYTIKLKSEFKRRSTANNVEILIPVPMDADSPNFKTSIGNVEYVPEKNCLKWNIKQLNGQKEYLMRAHFGLPSVTSNDAGQEDRDDALRAPINVKFEIPYFTVSGIQVRYLKIVEKSGYQALPWVRYITQNGDYQIRTT
mmetsp:Transcript_107784/g.131509  ORF Transcript_107784/g.131509 Transcript_107784/m.131509 type:complete len:438 (-) Transcript_107784:112-1425(-)